MNIKRRVWQWVAGISLSAWVPNFIADRLGAAYVRYGMTREDRGKYWKALDRLRK